MAHLPMDDAVILFDDNKQHNWTGMEHVLQQHKGKTDGISDNLIGMMMPIVHDMAQSHMPYPNSAQELDNELNNRLQKAPGGKARR